MLADNDERGPKTGPHGEREGGNGFMSPPRGGAITASQLRPGTRRGCCSGHLHRHGRALGRGLQRRRLLPPGALAAQHRARGVRQGAHQTSLGGAPEAADEEHHRPQSNCEAEKHPQPRDLRHGAEQEESKRVKGLAEANFSALWQRPHLAATRWLLLPKALPCPHTHTHTHAPHLVRRDLGHIIGVCGGCGR